MMRRSFLLPVIRLAVLLALLAVGAGVRARLAGEARADLNRSDMDGYSYEASEWRCVDWQKWKDPISVAFVYGALRDAVQIHAVHHGYNVIDLDDEQRFYDNGNCGFEDADAASVVEGVTPRFHFRSRVARLTSGAVDIDPSWGIFSVATPHYEAWSIPCGHP